LVPNRADAEREKPFGWIFSWNLSRKGGSWKIRVHTIHNA